MTKTSAKALARDKLWQQNNRGKVHVIHKRWRDKNKPQLAAKAKRFYSKKANRDKRDATARAWEEKNREKRNAQARARSAKKKARAAAAAAAKPPPPKPADFDSLLAEYEQFVLDLPFVFYPRCGNVWSMNSDLLGKGRGAGIEWFGMINRITREPGEDGRAGTGRQTGLGEKWDLWAQLGGNVLVSRDGVVKLADFGASKAYRDHTITDCMKSVRGSVFWMAPEVIRGTGYGRRADIWSLGCTVIEMLTGAHPWPHLDNQWTAMFTIAKTEEGPPRPKGISEEAARFLDKCLQFDPAKRPTAAELLQDPFVARLGGPVSGEDRLQHSF
ncbi:hypothetical protein HYH03_014487 [Edaphochlamys debaryana]|uniref:Protein kinase domain-containing protein n=1 Tax=Edaphochlamys debaryana TaxID=47281 RepID=A0A835XQ28_9CHLO|nr:hypothetical protein HYH03_014487 [Edaphochlamys debaryana]|eukprot:KAG2486893.1 hypothetical protein HYH03_014487 [Edaphochlamys debaryana]